ncbi:hypothetical protein X797_010871 [Metarhizium robertsii]|uniref:Uncharacterized protein n=1 Tax=Metarhizium robertsii TaxID=568076 RepID=A0A014N822_9HYPO|nr:hypothetical protein X797_010871 [Metarhizium robertsii]
MSEFFTQAVRIRYSSFEKLSEELDRILGKGNWKDPEVRFCDQYTLRVTRLLTDTEIDNINRNVSLHYTSRQ